MPFISVSDEVAKKSFTFVENKFISKYLPVLEPVAVKVYLYSLYLFQSGFSAFTLADLAESLSITEDEAKNYYEYLEEFELVSITSLTPFEVKILDAENIYGSPKKFKPEKYSDFTKAIQNILKGRMISTNEFREYFILLEEYGFEQNALIMIINYCVNLKGDDIRLPYIKKVAKSFATDGATTAKKVDEKLSAYTSVTPAILRLFSTAGIRKQPDIEDERLYKKWVDELGFDENAIALTAKLFKAKSCDKLDVVLNELYKNKKFDVKEIEDYCKNKNSVYSLTFDIAKNLGVYMQNPAPYVESYVMVWCNFGYSFEMLQEISKYCFKQGNNSFEGMNDFISNLYDEGLVSDGSVNEFIKLKDGEDRILKELLSTCGLTRKVITWDRNSLAKWRSWNFSDEMLFEAAKLSAGKSNPMAYMNGVLSSWKNEGIFTADKLTTTPSTSTHSSPDSRNERAIIERHYYDLRHVAEERAERAIAQAAADAHYSKIRDELNDLSIQLAFAEIRDKKQASSLSKRIEELEADGDMRLQELGIDKSQFVPHYSCSLCNDTGYDRDGKPCTCMEKFIKSIKI